MLKKQLLTPIISAGMMLSTCAFANTSVDEYMQNLSNSDPECFTTMENIVPLYKVTPEAIKCGQKNVVAVQWALFFSYYKVKNYKESFKWAKKVAEAPLNPWSADAMEIVGTEYLMGRAVKVDRKKGEMWLKKSVQLGNTSAQEVLNILYE